MLRVAALSAYGEAAVCQAYGEVARQPLSLFDRRRNPPHRAANYRSSVPPGRGLPLAALSILRHAHGTQATHPLHARFPTEAVAIVAGSCSFARLLSHERGHVMVHEDQLPGQKDICTPLDGTKLREMENMDPWVAEGDLSLNTRCLLIHRDAMLGRLKISFFVLGCVHATATGSVPSQVSMPSDNGNWYSSSKTGQVVCRRIKSSRSIVIAIPYKALENKIPKRHVLRSTPKLSFYSCRNSWDP